MCWPDVIYQCNLKQMLRFVPLLTLAIARLNERDFQSALLDSVFRVVRYAVEQVILSNQFDFILFLLSMAILCSILRFLWCFESLCCFRVFASSQN